MASFDVFLIKNKKNENKLMLEPEPTVGGQETKNIPCNQYVNKTVDSCLSNLKRASLM